MATIAIDYPSDLSPENAVHLFKARFHGRYEVYRTRMPMRDFVVKSNEWTAVGVRIRNRNTRTLFTFTAFTPSLLRRAIPAGGLAIGIIGAVFAYVIMHLALRPSWQALEQEVATAIRQEFAKPAIPNRSMPPFPSVSDVANGREEWGWTIRLALVASLFSLLTAFIAQNFVLIEVRILVASVTVRLAWSLLLAAVIGFVIGLTAASLRRR